MISVRDCATSHRYATSPPNPLFGQEGHLPAFPLLHQGGGESPFGPNAQETGRLRPESSRQRDPGPGFDGAGYGLRRNCLKSGRRF